MKNIINFRSSRLADRNVTIGMYPGADQPQRTFKIAISCFERVCVNGERCAKYNQRRSIFGTANCLLQAQSPTACTGIFTALTTSLS